MYIAKVVMMKGCEEVFISGTSSKHELASIWCMRNGIFLKLEAGLSSCVLIDACTCIPSSEAFGSQYTLPPMQPHRTNHHTSIVHVCA